MQENIFFVLFGPLDFTYTEFSPEVKTIASLATSCVLQLPELKRNRTPAPKVPAVKKSAIPLALIAVRHLLVGEDWIL
ncbi:hypothetical protein DPEC_G00148330 [Dallia pectoralis]|uniref:Uncharacterized protein n=1 Tax=Dallia pectoralis TaxID=75939 RepID=A0ACC2GIN4_DALPE|nr:hypothetical protein DPEC_G00148330 [Dallia pectoralis]